MSGENYRNSYTGPKTVHPKDIHLNTAPEDYDFNYVFPVTTLRSDRIELRPLVPSLHAQLLWEGYQQDRTLLRWLGTTLWESLQDVLEWIEGNCRAQPESLHYAIFTGPLDSSAPPLDPKDYTFAGTCGMIHSSAVHLMSEPGFIMILPPFQRTHVLTHAAGLMMHRMLDMPEQGGLGLRRCQWITTTLNEKSQNAAKRLGYTYEGVLRAFIVLPPNKEGVRPGRKGDRFENQMTRDSWNSSVIWEEWEGGVRDHVDKLMARKS